MDDSNIDLLRRFKDYELLRTRNLDTGLLYNKILTFNLERATRMRQ